MFISLKRIFRSGWHSFSGDKEILVATMFVLFLAISLVSTLFLFKDASQVLISIIQEKIDISVYFIENASEEDILNMGEKIAKFPEVEKIEYVSSEKALENFIEEHKEEPALLDSIDEIGQNPFLASLNIKAWDPSQYGKVSSFVEKSNFGNIIEKVDYHEREPVIKIISSLSSNITKFGISFSIILLIVAVLVTFNTIRLSIYNSKEEIKIQRLVGAANWYIRGPFLVQGIVSGILATLISILVLSVTYWFLSPKLAVFSSDLNLFALFIGNFWAIVLIQFTTGIGLGIISSTIAIRKYLKV